MSARIKAWLQKHRNQLASADGLPGEYMRESFFHAIKIGDTVGIVTPHGSVLGGRATIRGRQHGQTTHWVLNGGGPHGTPLIADARNTIFVPGVKFLGGGKFQVGETAAA